MSFQIEQQDANTLSIIFSGRLDMDSVAKLWQPCLSAIKQKPPRKLLIDVENVEYCDGAGIALLQALQIQQMTGKNSCTIKGLKQDFKNLLIEKEQQQIKVEAKSSPKHRLLENLGRIGYGVTQGLRNNIVFLGTLAYQLCFVCLRPSKIRWIDFWKAMEDVGPRAFPIVALIGFLIGLISTFQAAPSFGQFGAQILMVNLVGLGLVREMGPLLTAVLLAGRTSSAFAAEIGTMKINQEINALNTMGINPIRFLVIPRILATMIITPFLEVFLIIFGLLGCFAVMSSLGYSWDAFIHQLNQAIKLQDYMGGLIKVFVFGWVIAGVGCLNGLKTTFDAQAVGRSTTKAVVSSLIMLVILDGIFATVYYILGI